MEHKRTRVIVSIPDPLLDIIEDFRGSCRPVKSRNAAIVHLLGDAAVAWINKDMSDEDFNALVARIRSEGDHADAS